MTDIVERLRDENAVVLSGLFHAIPAMRDAADEIELLRAALVLARIHFEQITDGARVDDDILEAIERVIPNLQTRASTSLIDIPKNCEGPPCGECHLQPGELCDICGRRAAFNDAQTNTNQARLGSLVLRLPAAQVGFKRLLRRHLVVYAVELQLIDSIAGDADPHHDLLLLS